MNQERRKLLAKAWSILEDVSCLESEALDNLPDAFQFGAKGEAMQEAIDQIEEANALLDGIINPC